jgi:hypothetical protein
MPDSVPGTILREAARRLAQETRTLVRKPLNLVMSPSAAAGAAAPGHEGHAH